MGVIAILIIIMVLELKIPQGADWQVVRPILPTLLSYVLSFIFLGIYWDFKGKLSLALYAAGILLPHSPIPGWEAAYTPLVAALWFIPDPRIESRLDQKITEK